METFGRAVGRGLETRAQQVGRWTRSTVSKFGTGLQRTKDY
jgi:hypothetical protein